MTKEMATKMRRIGQDWTNGGDKNEIGDEFTYLGKNMNNINIMELANKRKQRYASRETPRSWLMDQNT